MPDNQDPKVELTDENANKLLREALRLAGGDILVAVSSLAVAAGRASGASDLPPALQVEALLAAHAGMKVLLNPTPPTDPQPN